MTLAFLSPDPGAGIPARGPLVDAAMAAGGVPETRDGWEVVVGFGEPESEAAACARSVGFADLSHLRKTELQTSGARPWRAADSSVPGIAGTRGSGWLCAVTPTLALALGVSAEELAAERGEDGVRIADVTACYGALALVGPRARDTFSRFCALDLRETAMPVAAFRPASVARAPGFVLREEEQRFLLLFGAALGEYMWEVVADAAASFGGRPVGLDALRAHRGETVHA